MTKPKSAILILLIATLSCTGQDSSKVNKIESNYHKVVIRYAAPWKALPGLDTKEQSIIGVINYKNGTSYIIKVAQDISKEKISEKAYFAYTKQKILKENPKNRLLKEEEVTFHGQKYHRQVYLLFTRRWGLLKHYYAGCRAGDFYYGIQVSFPVSEEKANEATWPPELVLLDENVLIDDK